MKFSVTPELATLLKTIRMQNGISAKDLANAIGKSPSYVSKLESGDVKKIVKEDLTEILTYISAGGDFFEAVLPNAYRVLQSFMPPERIIDQIWLLHYDVIERIINVPEAMADEILQRLAEQNMTPENLAERINENVDSEMSAAFPANEIVTLKTNGKSRLMYRVQVSKDEIKQLLTKKTHTTSYMLLNNITFEIMRLIQFPNETKKLPSESAVKVLRSTAAYMEQYSIHSLTGFSHFISSDEFINYQVPLATGVSVDNTNTIELITETFRAASNHDALNTTQQLNVFLETLNWDPAFAFKLIEIPFSELGSLSYTNKKNLLGEIREIMEKYENMSDFEKKLESY